MGEDFLRNKTEQFVRYRNRGYARLVEANLLSGLPAEESTEVTGAACSTTPPKIGEYVWPHAASDGSVVFYAGDEECVRVPPARAGDLPKLIQDGSVVGQIVDTDAELGHVRLRFKRMEGNDDGQPTDPR